MKPTRVKMTRRDLPDDYWIAYCPACGEWENESYSSAEHVRRYSQLCYCDGERHRKAVRMTPHAAREAELRYSRKTLAMAEAMSYQQWLTAMKRRKKR